MQPLKTVYILRPNNSGYVHNNVHYKIVIVKSCDMENVHQQGTMSPSIMWNTGQPFKKNKICVD